MNLLHLGSYLQRKGEGERRVIPIALGVLIANYAGGEIPDLTSHQSLMQYCCIFLDVKISERGKVVK